MQSAQFGDGECPALHDPLRQAAHAYSVLRSTVPVEVAMTSATGGGVCRDGELDVYPPPSRGET